MGLFADYFPSHIEWINDSSCKPPPQRDSSSSTATFHRATH